MNYGKVGTIIQVLGVGKHEVLEKINASQLKLILF
jgi:hypothetical protein